MAINQPLASRNQDPWRRNAEEGPPDLAHLIKSFFTKLSRQKSPQSKFSGNASLLLGSVVAVVLVLWLLSGVFLVGPAEQAVILRFGKYVSTVNSGPHWIIPFIESQKKVNVQKISSFPYQSEMLTKDENIVTVKLQIQYRIANPKEYLFNVVSPEKTLQQAISSALRQIVGQMDLDPLITTGRQNLTQQVTAQLNSILNLYKTGIEVVDVALQEVKPPAAVTPAFDDVVKAREDRQSYINKAVAYSKNRVLAASGVAARLKQEADAYRFIVVARAKGESARYLALLKPYKEAPEVTQERLYLDTLAGVLSKTKNIVVDVNNGNNIFYLPIDQMSSRKIEATLPSSKLLKNNLEENEIDNATSSSVSGRSSSGSSSFYPDRPSYTNHGEQY